MYEIVVSRHVVIRTSYVEFLELDLDALLRRIYYTKIVTRMCDCVYHSCVRYCGSIYYKNMWCAAHGVISNDFVGVRTSL